MSPDYNAVHKPVFCADSAYSFVAAQLDCGFRTPGSKGQALCSAYIVNMMKRWCDTVVVQNFNATLWNGTPAKGKNIIATLYASDDHDAPHLLLAAHWDSRLWADHDPDAANHHSPIPGANDGASGVAVLMEMARVMSALRPSASIDFVFFDLEDQGIPEWADDFKDDTWCLGSQFWSRNPHVPFYNARYGVLFDMVGTDRPRFTKEQFSRQYASGILDKMWRAADALGHGNIFVDVTTDPVLDDHVYINRLASVPTLDVVQNDPNTSFYPYWHTLRDNLEAVNAQTLKIVADVVLATIYADYPHKDTIVLK